MKYSPNGSHFASAGFDGKVFLYDGATADLISEIGSPAHKGGVYGVAWKPDGKQLLTCSGDKTCKLWDVETKTMISEFVMGNTVDDQQVSCLWQGDYLLSVSLSGFINYLNVNDPSKPLRIVKGHNKPITVLALSEDRSFIYTGSHDGFITNWQAGSGENDRVEGVGHGNQVNGMIASGDNLYTCGIDDTLKIINKESNSYTNINVKLKSQPRGIAQLEDSIIAASVKDITIVQNNSVVHSLDVNFEPTCIAANKETKEVAVGGSSDFKVHVYSLSGKSLTPKVELDHLGAVTDVAYSPDLKYLVASDANRKVILYSLPEYKVIKLSVIYNIKFYGLLI